MASGDEKKPKVLIAARERGEIIIDETNDNIYFISPYSVKQDLEEINILQTYKTLWLSCILGNFFCKPSRKIYDYVNIVCNLCHNY